VVQIAFALDFNHADASDTASSAEDNRDQTSGAATPTGVKSARSRKWYSLYDKVYTPANLHQAWLKVRSNKGAPGSDGVTIKRFEQDLEAQLQSLHDELREKRYCPRPVRRKLIPKAGGGKRQLGIPCVRDRIVQQALQQILGPIFESKFSKHSHGFRPGKGCATALKVVDAAVFGFDYKYVVDADISKFFDTVDHEMLLAAVNEEIADGSVLKLIEAFLKSGILLDDLEEIEASDLGTPQGGPLSPLLANIYLHPLDKAMAEAGFGMVRYADDFVVLTKTREQAEDALALAREILTGLKLQLHPEKTHVAAVDDGFAFLGYRYFLHRGRKSSSLQKIVCRKSIQRFRDSIRTRTRRRAGQRKPKAKRITLDRLRRNKHVQKTISQLNDYIRGWHWYFKSVYTTWDKYFLGFDEFVRRRLRSAITGRLAIGPWHKKLTNELLAELGLLSLVELQKQYERHQLQAPPSSG
jgi:RNA-directed DNA polymerase